MNCHLKVFIVVTSIALILWGCASTIQNQSQKILANRDAILADLYKLGADAYQHKIGPVSMGGGNGAYDGSAGGDPYVLKSDGPWGISNPNATYTIIFDGDGRGAAPVFWGQFK